MLHSGENCFAAGLYPPTACSIFPAKYSVGVIGISVGFRKINALIYIALRFIAP